MGSPRPLRSAQADRGAASRPPEAADQRRGSPSQHSPAQRCTPPPSPPTCRSTPWAVRACPVTQSRLWRIYTLFSPSCSFADAWTGKHAIAVALHPRYTPPFLLVVPDALWGGKRSLARASLHRTHHYSDGVHPSTRPSAAWVNSRQRGFSRLTLGAFERDARMLVPLPAQRNMVPLLHYTISGKARCRGRSISAGNEFSAWRLEYILSRPKGRWGPPPKKHPGDAGRGFLRPASSDRPDRELGTNSRLWYHSPSRFDATKSEGQGVRRREEHHRNWRGVRGLGHRSLLRRPGQPGDLPGY